MNLKDKLERSRNQTSVFPRLRQTIEGTWRRAGTSGIEALDGVETHGCFTTTEYVALHHRGLAAPGQRWQTGEDGTPMPGGRCPVNMGGGLMAVDTRLAPPVHACCPTAAFRSQARPAPRGSMAHAACRRSTPAALLPRWRGFVLEAWPAA